MNRALWIVQGLLAALFVFAAAAKFVTPAEAMVRQMPVPLSVMFVKFIGVCELLGAAGLILPGLLGIRPGLTPLAAAGLVIIMIGAITITVMGGQAGQALFPAMVGLLAGFIAYGRWKLVPIGRATRTVSA